MSRWKSGRNSLIGPQIGCTLRINVTLGARRGHKTQLAGSRKTNQKRYCGTAQRGRGVARERWRTLNHSEVSLVQHQQHNLKLNEIPLCNML